MADKSGPPPASLGVPAGPEHRKQNSMSQRPAMPRLAEQIPTSILQTLSVNEIQRQEVPHLGRPSSAADSLDPLRANGDRAPICEGPGVPHT